MWLEFFELCLAIALVSLIIALIKWRPPVIALAINVSIVAVLVGLSVFSRSWAISLALFFPVPLVCLWRIVDAIWPPDRSGS
jgi:hypothetical protein